MLDEISLQVSHSLLVATLMQLWAVRRAEESWERTSIFSRSSNFADASREKAQRS